jgi:hypothetical protein
MAAASIGSREIHPALLPRTSSPVRTPPGPSKSLNFEISSVVVKIHLIENL